MNKKHSNHELAAIVFTDIVGFTAAMENNESKAMDISGIPLPKILKFDKTFQEWGEKFFSHFFLLNEETNFWNEFENNWPNKPIEIPSPPIPRIP